MRPAKQKAPERQPRGLSDNTSKQRQYIENPRQRRLLAALLSGAVTRNEADAIAHASNGPDVVLKLRERGLLIDTERVPCADADGRPSFYGRYRLAHSSKARARALLQRVVA